MKFIYAVSVKYIPTGDSALSGDCYDSYGAAKGFILNRSDKPVQLTDFSFKSDEYYYYINMLTLR